MGNLKAVRDFFVEIDGLHDKLNLEEIRQRYNNAEFEKHDLHRPHSQKLLRMLYSLNDVTVERQCVMDYVRGLCNGISSYDDVVDSRIPETKVHTVNEIFRLSREFDEDDDREKSHLIDRFWDNIMTTVGIYFLTLDVHRF